MTTSEANPGPCPCWCTSIPAARPMRSYGFEAGARCITSGVTSIVDTGGATASSRLPVTVTGDSTVTLAFAESGLAPACASAATAAPAARQQQSQSARMRVRVTRGVKLDGPAGAISQWISAPGHTRAPPTGAGVPED